MNTINVTSAAGLVKNAYSAGKQTPADAQKSFAGMLNHMLHKVNDSQTASNTATENLVIGKTTDLHQVMIAAEKASLTLQTTLEIRNKVIEAYQEVMRTQM
ncbi:flagellar hook-basal body complex protein FliE [Fictibacillus sp. KIGAM418]|uniref:Flagellar hook-basal body complex protein FliE n=1 Tax=Fictibacillus marinisediminis TaxID=2878389 RepID=A0A9X2BGY9_9BACL|nr:flagellar hook-basal body complex protein FliE [Fictibacillus marinisediminis]MCK6257008.1 flagellar hook-basal body complex protein FliE [Fictibacillus marinisediminis]